MTKNQIISFAIVLGLSLLFIVISVMYVFNSKSPKLLKYKLKIGAAIIALTTFVSSHGFSQKTCYKPAYPREMINMNKQDEANYIFIHKNDTKITGVMRNVLSQEYLYSITDTANKPIKKGKLIPANGLFDENKEDFEIQMGKLKVGDYYLKIYSNGKEFERSTYLYEGTIVVTGRKEPAVTCYYY